jgi:peptidyl-prolyl cis-trans isomerase SurA
LGLLRLDSPPLQVKDVLRMRLKSSHFAVVAALLSSTLAFFPSVLHADAVIEEIIVRVNNEIVTRTEFIHSKDQLKSELRQQEPQDGDKLYAERERDVLRDLIDQQLLLEKGKELDINVDTDLIKRLDEMRKQMGLESMEDLEKAAQSQGTTLEDFKLNMKNGMITQKVIGREVGSHLTIAKEEIQKFYEEHKDQFAQTEQVKLNELLVSTEKMGPDGKTPIQPDDAALQAAEAKAKDLLEQIHKGASFEDVAKKNSDGPTASQGGDIGYFQRGQLSKDLEDKTFAMKVDEVSDPVRTKQGFVLLKVTEHTPAGVATLKEAEPKIQDALYYQKLQPALRTYLTKLREDAYIEIKPGYVDSGASPNQTKFVQTKGADITAKELKKKKKFGLFSDKK